MDNYSDDIFEANRRKIEKLREASITGMAAPVDPAKLNEEEIFCSSTFDEMYELIKSVERGEQ